MGGLTTAELVRRHQTIGLDSNLLIYLIDDVSPMGRASRRAGDAVDGGRRQRHVGARLTEILSRTSPRDGDLGRLERNNDDIRTIPGLDIVPLAPEVAADAAVIRGIRDMALADAIHLASAGPRARRPL